MTSATQMPEIATAAYRLHTGGALSQSTTWQSALYERLSTRESDASYLLRTPTGAGKTEAVVIPALGAGRGGAPRRLFIIGPDGSPLDDYLYRLVPYLRASVGGDETPRTLCLDLMGDEDAEGNLCRRFFPDGTEDPGIERNPLEADVDLVLTTFSSFRALFFGGGGIHALSSNPIPADGLPLRRDLFFFDEAHSYEPTAFSSFQRLVRFLFAEDTDVIVGTSTMPASYAEEFGFLEPINAALPLFESVRSLSYLPGLPGDDPLDSMEQMIRRSYYQNARVFGVTETAPDAEMLNRRLMASYPHSVYIYHAEQPAEVRRHTYAQLRELEKEGEGYLLLTTGSTIETSDLDASVLLSTLCPPENLIRRAGRCNRRADLPDAQVILVGSTFAPSSRTFPASEAYRAALRDQSGTAFDAETWKSFI